FTSPLRIPRHKTIQFVESLHNSPYVEIVHVNTALDAEAWNLLAARPDKNWSLADCASFVVMRHMSIQKALTSDHHFTQAGFVPLLNQPST
ncbi:VapC toxin family PIN domain ribonuclease, partial [Arthrospira platensis SPKY2]